MTVVNPKSISGINSITTGSGSDNLLTIHTSDASSTERVRINSSGDVIVGSGITVSPDGDIFATGVTTSTTFVGALTGNVTGNISGGTVAGSTGTFTGDVDIADKIVHTGDTNTAIRFPSADTITAETGGSERIRIDSGGKILVGATSSRNVAGGYAKLQVEATSSEGVSITRTSADNGAVYLTLSKTRNGSACQAGDNIGSISWNPDDGTDLNHPAAEIQTLVASGIGGDDVPGDLVFKTNGGATSTTERLRINSSGNLKVGNTSDRDLGGLSVQRLHIEGTDGGSSAIGLVNNQNSTGQAALYFSKSRGTSVGSNTILQDGDPMGSLVFCGADGNDMVSIGAQITASVNGTPGSNDMPGLLAFSVTADGAATPTERLRIISTGVLQVNTNTTPGGNPSGGGEANSNGFLHLMSTTGENAMCLVNATTIANNAAKGTVLTGINFLNRNYYTSSGRAGTNYVIREEKGHASYMDRGQLRFVPGYDGQTLYTNRSVVFDFDGHILPGDDDYANLGGGSYRWDNVYATNGSIQTSDENLKQNIQSLSTAEMNAAARISKLFITYKWKSKVAKEEAGGNAARIHTGIIAQRIKESLEAEGLTAANYSFWCENITWKDSEGNVAGDGRTTGPGVYDELTNTTPSTDGYTKSVDYAVRYTELLSFVAAYNEQRFTSIESRLDAAGL